MSQEASFLHAITESPADDGPRLVYADWLDDRGDPHGEFIRTQYQLARLPEDDPQVPELRRREQELLTENGESWAGPRADAISSPMMMSFVTEGQTGHRTFLEVHYHGSARTPPYTALEVHDPDREAASRAVLFCPLLTQGAEPGLVQVGSQLAWAGLYAMEWDEYIEVD